MSHSAARNLFATKLTEYATTKGIRVSYDNFKLTPSANETYLETHLIPASTTANTLGGDHKRFVGLYQIKVIVGSGIATAASAKIVDELQTVFPVDSLYTDVNGFTVQVISPVHSPEGKVQEGKWIIPCYFEYEANTN